MGGRRGTSFTTRLGACEAEGGAPAAGRSSGAHRRDSGAGRAARSSDRHSEGRGGGTRGHTGGTGRQGRGCRRCPPPPQPGRRRSGASNSSSPLRSPVLRGEPRPSGGPAGKSAPYLEEGTDLILLQVGLDPGLLVRRHEELRRRGLELLFPGGGCSPSGCSRLAPPPPKGYHSGSGVRRCEGAAARSPRDGANSGNRGRGGG